MRRWDPAALERAAADLGARVATMVGLQDEIDTVRAVRGWQGAAAAAAARAGQGLLDRLEGAVAGAVAVRGATSQAAAAVADLRRRLQAVDDRAHEAGLVLAPDGAITAPPTPAEPPPTLATGSPGVAPPDAARQQVAEELHRQLGTIMADASALDAAYRAALDAAARDEFSPDRAPGSGPDTLEGAARFGAINAALEPAPTPPAANASPEAIAEWFNRLPPIQREQAQNDPRNWALLGASPTIPAAVRERVHRASNAAAFHAITGTDPVSANDWRTAAMLDPRTGARSPTDPSGSIRVVRINPVPGAGIIGGSAFISSRTVSDLPIPGLPPGWLPGGEHDGDNRGFDPNAGPTASRAAYTVDYDRGLVVVRQNPTHATDGSEVAVGEPRVGVEQNPAGEVRLRFDAENPLTPGPNEPPRELGYTVRSDTIITPGHPGQAPEVNGRVSQYPSWENYHYGDDGSIAPVGQRQQNTDIQSGPFLNLPQPTAPVGPDPNRLIDWYELNHPDAIPDGARYAYDVPAGGDESGFDPWPLGALDDTPPVGSNADGTPDVPPASPAR